MACCGSKPVKDIVREPQVPVLSPHPVSPPAATAAESKRVGKLVPPAAALLAQLKGPGEMSTTCVSPGLTAVARRLATAMGSGAACCITTANGSNWSLQCGVGGTRQFVPSSATEHPRDEAPAPLQGSHQQRCGQMLADIIAGDTEGCYGRCQPGWMDKPAWVGFWDGIQPAADVDGGQTVRVVVSHEGQFAPTPAAHAAVVGAGGREWHVQACWDDASLIGLFVSPLDRTKFPKSQPASAAPSSSPPASEGVPSSSCTIGDKWHLGSCTKAMTSTLLAIFVEEGVVNWDSTLGATVLRDAFDGTELPNGYGDITLLQLLTQTSGVCANPCPPDEWSLAWKLHEAGVLSPKQQRREFCRAFLENVPLVAHPGTNPKHVYSNLNCTLAALMLEEVTGRAWEEMMTERLFGPLGMSSAGFGAAGAELADLAGRQSQPWAHTSTGEGGAVMTPVDPREANPDNPPDNPHAIAPAGRVHCSVEDWARYLAVHLNHSVAHEKLGLSPRTMATLEAHQLRESRGHDYAGGWSLSERAWARCAEDSRGWTQSHDGSNGMNYCSVWLAPAQQLGVFVCCNSSPPGAAAMVDGAIGELLAIHGE